LQLIYYVNIVNFMKVIKKETLESSIKILTDLTMSDLKYCESNSFSNNDKVQIKLRDDTHLFFDWDSWTFIDKKLYNK